MGIALLCAAVLSQRIHRRTLWRVVLPAAVLLGLLTCLDVPQFPGPALLSKFLEEGLHGREINWANAWALFLDAPLVGQGPHTYRHFHRKPWPYNLYLEVLAEQGLFGFAALMGMLVCGLIGGWRLRRAPTEDGRLMGAGALAGLIGLCSAGMVELTLLREWVVTMLFMLLGVIGHLVSTQLPHKETLEERRSHDMGLPNGGRAA
jgi:O-antigen ligase